VTDRAASMPPPPHRGALGRIDFLVNSAGFAGPTVPLDEYDPDQWTRIVDVNLVGVYNVCRAVVPLMRQAGQGRIVNIASLAGKEGTPNASAYSAAKAGVLALTKSLARNWRPPASWSTPSRRPRCAPRSSTRCRPGTCRP
jgi:NAD(P)-dependent dehydrogenase (short-subunit alcohol dehydrogenase family)